MKTYFWKKYRIKNPGLALSVLNNKTKFYKPLLMMLPSIITILLFTLIPFLLVLIKSFQMKMGFAQGVYTVGFGNYTRIFTSSVFGVALRNSLVYAILSIPISLGISLLISSAIVQLVKKWSRGFWQTVFFLPYVTSAIAVSMAFSVMFDQTDGLINKFLLNWKIIDTPIQFLSNTTPGNWNAFWIILIRGVWGSLAFQILILTTAMLSVNQDLYKAASIDGASTNKQFYRITLPSITKTISFLFTMGLIGGIKTFPLALFNNSASSAMQNQGATLILYIFNYTSQGRFDIAAAASVILFVIGLIFSKSVRKIASLIYIASVKTGEKNVINKIENKTLKRKPVFKI
ncbi:carbohydrate ABC transporter permease [Metamycoplasma neophronis]|uniref:Sugar ABC transporter permease n=1 Tax=Metamycoplasma neophronis TaxID=872983 RepID=A0ABY2Z0G9_9BACT|nr:sugar ABC transporter permease [Metamycoplasma neophronis]TPR54648.1 sugar ABC transporter permease [Metamycoplasma neophronis]